MALAEVVFDSRWTHRILHGRFISIGHEKVGVSLVDVLIQILDILEGWIPLIFIGMEG
jgi:hypothetical protein